MIKRVKFFRGESVPTARINFLGRSYSSRTSCRTISIVLRGLKMELAAQGAITILSGDMLNHWIRSFRVFLETVSTARHFLRARFKVIRSRYRAFLL